MRNELVLIQDEQAVTTSLIVAESFEKEHRHVLDSVREILTAENSAVRFFKETTYKNERGKDYPLYEMNRDGFMLLAMGFTGAKAMKFKLAFIDAFNKMEKSLQGHAVSDSVISTEMQLAKAVLLAQAVIEKMRSKAEYAERVLLAESSHTITTIAKELGMSARKLNDLLHTLGVQYKTDDCGWVLYAKHDGKGYIETKTHVYNDKGIEKTNIYTVWTEKGRNFIHEQVKSTLKEG